MPFSVGVLGVPLPSVSRVQPRQLASLREQGVGCVGLYMTERERAVPSTWSPRLTERLHESGLQCLYVVGPLRNLTAGGDAGRRAVEDTAHGLSAAAALGADRLLIGPGSFSPGGPWWYHPANFGVEARAALVRSLRELARRADALGVRITVEGHPYTVLESPAVMRELLDEVDSPAAGASLDYVNFLSPPAMARFERSIRELAAALGPHLTAVHVKDAVVRPRLVVHVDELAAGDGDLDLYAAVALARRLDVPAVLEHLTRSRAEHAIEHIVRLAFARFAR